MKPPSEESRQQRTEDNAVTATLQGIAVNRRENEEHAMDMGWLIIGYKHAHRGKRQKIQ